MIFPLQFLQLYLPQDIVFEIALFEGTVTRAYLKEHISQIYSLCFQRFFGPHRTLRSICEGDPRFDNLHKLKFYSRWVTKIKTKYPQFVKIRKCRKYMKPYYGLIPLKLLETERINVENEVTTYFMSSTLLERAYVQCRFS